MQGSRFAGTAIAHHGPHTGAITDLGAHDIVPGVIHERPERDLQRGATWFGAAAVAAQRPSHACS